MVVLTISMYYSVNMNLEHRTLVVSSVMMARKTR